MLLRMSWNVLRCALSDLAHLMPRKIVPLRDLPCLRTMLLSRHLSELFPSPYLLYPDCLVCCLMQQHSTMVQVQTARRCRLCWKR